MISVQVVRGYQMSSDDRRKRQTRNIANTTHIDLSEELRYELGNLDESVFRTRAKSFLLRPNYLVPFNQEEVDWLVQYMHPYSIPAGELFILEEDQSNNDFMMLILSGQVVVEAEIASDQCVTVSVLNEGKWVGEMSMLDEQPRQASCRASDDADVVCAILSRKDLLDIVEHEPRIAVKLALMLATNMAGHVRQVNAKMCRYAEIQNAIRAAT